MKKMVFFIALALLISQAVAGEAIRVNVTGEWSSNRLAKKILSYTGGSGDVTILFVFDDGNLLEVNGKGRDTRDFLEGKMTEGKFLESLGIKWLTRGPLFMPGVCEPSKGEDCTNAMECACYESQRCEPGHPKANGRGCVDPVPPENARLLYKEYVCKEGFVWNGNGSGCVRPLECPENTIELEGKCIAKDGHEIENDKTPGNSPPHAIKNTPPTVRIILSSENVVEEQSVHFKAKVYDTDQNDTHSFTWRLGRQTVGTGSTFAWKPKAPGTYTVTVTVFDGTDMGSDSYTFTVDMKHTGLTPASKPQPRETHGGWESLSNSKTSYKGLPEEPQPETRHPNDSWESINSGNSSY